MDSKINTYSNSKIGFDILLYLYLYINIYIYICVCVCVCVYVPCRVECNILPGFSYLMLSFIKNITNLNNVLNGNNIIKYDICLSVCCITYRWCIKFNI